MNIPMAFKESTLNYWCLKKDIMKRLHIIRRIDQRQIKDVLMNLRREKRKTIKLAAGELFL